MHFGFGHVNTYPLKVSRIASSRSASWTAGDVINEASRKTEHCPHVQNPQKPLIFYGCNPRGLEKRLKEFCSINKDQYQTKSGKEAFRKIRSDKHVLVAAVFSWPEPVDSFNRERFNQFAQDCIKFFEKEHGIECKSAVKHLDEGYPHVHIYGFSTDARGCHAGWIAKRAALALAPNDQKAADKAYKLAMQGYQDRYFEEVTSKYAMARIGPRIKRLPRRLSMVRKVWLQAKSKGDMTQKIYRSNTGDDSDIYSHTSTSIASTLQQAVTLSADDIFKVTQPQILEQQAPNASSIEAFTVLEQINVKDPNEISNGEFGVTLKPQKSQERLHDGYNKAPPDEKVPKAKTENAATNSNRILVDVQTNSMITVVSLTQPIDSLEKHDKATEKNPVTNTPARNDKNSAKKEEFIKPQNRSLKVSDLYTIFFAKPKLKEIGEQIEIPRQNIAPEKSNLVHVQNNNNSNEKADSLNISGAVQEQLQRKQAIPNCENDKEDEGDDDGNDDTAPIAPSP